MTQENKKRILFVSLFAILALIALQIPLNKLVGSSSKFTAFDAFGPIAGGFLGSLPGILAVLLAEIANFFIRGAKVIDAGTIVRFFPMLFAAWYFGSKDKKVGLIVGIVVPLLTILSFNLNPVGRSVWYFSLYWLIPVACYFFKDKFLLARALGATFTAHAVGGAAWIWIFNLPKAMWVSLIPVVAMERLIFTLGIAISYVAVNNILAVLDDRKIVNVKTLVNPTLIWNKLLIQKS
ncbi:MAG: hypothetical protein HYZ51_03930 [Candidatus Doudnabacteria bacterium]|nr:hypothetical protein [Candidatus Doudnabacteria bacterium]